MELAAQVKPMPLIHIDHLTLHIHVDLTEVLAHLDSIEGKVDQLMTDVEDFRALLGRVNDATNDIAKDVRELIARIATSMTQADVDEVKAGLESAAVALESAAAEYTGPDVPPFV